MVKVVGPLYSEEARGSIGKTLTYRVTKGQQYVTPYRFPTKPPTEAQKRQRKRFGQVESLVTYFRDHPVGPPGSKKTLWETPVRVGQTSPSELFDWWESELARLADRLVEEYKSQVPTFNTQFRLLTDEYHDYATELEPFDTELLGTLCNAPMMWVFVWLYSTKKGSVDLGSLWRSPVTPCGLEFMPTNNPNGNRTDWCNLGSDYKFLTQADILRAGDTCDWIPRV